MRKLLVVALLFVAGCSAETKLTEGRVVDTSYTPSWVQIVPVGKTLVPITHPEICEVLVYGWVGGEGNGPAIEEWHDDDCSRPLSIGDRWSYE